MEGAPGANLLTSAAGAATTSVLPLDGDDPSATDKPSRTPESGLLVYLADNKTQPQEQKQGLLYKPVWLKARFPRFDTTSLYHFYIYCVSLVTVIFFVSTCGF